MHMYVWGGVAGDVGDECVSVYIIKEYIKIYDILLLSFGYQLSFDYSLENSVFSF